MRLIGYITFFLTLFAFDSGAWAAPPGQPGWKAGVARAVITPGEYIWMAGFAARESPAESKIHDLWAKAVALEDAEGTRAVLVTADILGFTKGMSDRIRERLHDDFGLSKSQIILNSSHTHSGPVLTDALIDIYPVDVNNDKRVARYTAWLESEVVRIAAEAIAALKPAGLYSQNGVARFQVNRRNNSRALSAQAEVKGPVDYAVPVIKIADEKGSVMAVVFGYACHPTTLSGTAWCGDYPGFAQIDLEGMYPGCTALFFQGACGDQNPLPRGTVPLARQYGLTLAAAVDRVLQDEMKPLSPSLKTAYTEIELPLAATPTKAELEQRAARTPASYPERFAARMLEQVARGEALRQSYPYPLQIWDIGGQTLLSLGGELVTGYSVGLKSMFGQDSFVMGYANDVMGYIPTLTILREGGYEGDTSQSVYGLPTKWSEDIERIIYQNIENMGISMNLISKKQ